MLWVDKHRPNTLDKLDINDPLTQRLRSISADGEIPHLLFYGPSGAGKKTRVQALLREIYGSGVERVRLEHRSFKTPSNKPLEVTTVASNYHIELSPGDAGGIYDRYVVQEVVKQIAQSQNLTSGIAEGGGGGGGEGGASSMRKKRPTFVVVVIMGADQLTKQAQAALRRTMEKFTSSCRLILCCNSASKIIDPVRSRCLALRVPAPTHAEIETVMRKVSKKEGGGQQLPQEVAARISHLSARNLRKALLMLETAHVQCGSTPQAEQKIPLTDWELYTASIAKDILRDQSPQKLLVVREKLYELLVNCIPADVILRTLTAELFKMIDDDVKHQVAHWAAFYEVRLHQGSKHIFHLEAFVARVMGCYRQYNLDLFC